MGILSLFRRKTENDLISVEGGPGDCKENAVVIHAPNCTSKSFYFDITDFFGKF